MAPPKSARKARITHRDTKKLKRSYGGLGLSEYEEIEDAAETSEEDAGFEHGEIARDPMPPPPPIFSQQRINPRQLPLLVSCFCKNNLMTRALMFNFGRVPTIQTVKQLVNEHFVWEFMRLSIPSTIKFLGLNCFYPSTSNNSDRGRYWMISTESEYQQWFAEIVESAGITTGMIARIQVCFMTEKQMMADKRRLADWFENPIPMHIDNLYPATEISGQEWMFEEMEKKHERRKAGKELLDPRLFEVDPDHRELLTAPAHVWRENAEKGRQYDDLWKIHIEWVRGQKHKKRRVKELLLDVVDEVRGLREILKEEGIRLSREEIKDSVLYNRVGDKDHPGGKLTVAQAVAIQAGRQARSEYQKGRGDDADADAGDEKLMWKLRKEYEPRVNEFDEDWNL